MNKLISKIVGVALGLSLAVGTGVAVAANNNIVPALAADQYIETAFASLATGDVGVIVGNNGGYFALSNNNDTRSAPTATSVGVSSGKLSEAPAATLLWQVSVNSGSYQFTVYGGSNKLYCTNSNNGVRVGTNSNNAFTIDGGYLKNVVTSRYVGIYNSSDWRCYTSSGGNIANQSFAFYKKTADTSGETIAVQSVTMSSASETVKVGKAVTLSATISPDNATCSLVSWLSSDASVATVENGTVNGVAAGSATITAFADENSNGTLDSSEKRATCNVTVQEVETINSNVADALTEAAKLASGETSGDLYCVTGYVTSVEEPRSSYNNVSFSIADAQGGTPVIPCYRIHAAQAVGQKVAVGAKVAVTGNLKNHSGTLKVVNNSGVETPITILEESSITYDEPTMKETTLAGFIGATSDTEKAELYHFTAKVKAVTNTTYGNMTLTDDTNELTVYGSTATTTALVWGTTTGIYSFNNPQDFGTNNLTKDIAAGDMVEVKFIRYMHSGALNAQGIIVDVIPAPTLSVSVDSLDLNVGETSSAITATLTNATDVQNISWAIESNTTDVISLSTNSGTSITVTANAVGTETINVTYGTLVKTISVTVTDPMASNTGTINFGYNATPIDSTSVTGNDNLNKTWTVTTVGTTSFTNTNNSGFAQVGSGSKPATSISFSALLGDEYNVTSFSAKFGGFSGTVGSITLKVDSTSVATGSLNAASDVTISSSSVSTGSSLSIEITDIAKGVKVYYISYTITQSAAQDIPVESVSIGDDISLAKGNKQQLTATVLPVDATNKNVTWSSSNDEVATVNDSGLVTAVAEGTANITCSSVEDNTIVDTIQVTVTAAVLKSLSISSVNNAFTLGATLASHFGESVNVIKANMTDGTQFVKTLDDMSVIKIANAEVQKNHLMSSDDAGSKVELTYTEGDISVKSSITNITVSSSETAASFASTFLDTLSTGTGAVCDADGNTNLGDLQAAWELFAESYASLSITDKSVFENATANESGTDIEKAVALYDYIGSKYNTQLQSATLTNYNFIGRAGAANANNHISPIANMNNNGLIIVAITAFVTMTFIGGYFFLRKKKEN